MKLDRSEFNYAGNTGDLFIRRIELAGIRVRVKDMVRVSVREQG